MRAKIYRISAQQFMDLLVEKTTHNFFVDAGIPKDSKVISIRYTQDVPHTIDLMIESEHFDMVPEGEPLPIAPPIVVNASV